MFDWTGVPIGLFDIYMEVGEIKALKSAGTDYVPIEVWIGCCSSKNRIRPECRDIRRRPVYGVMKQILRLCGEKQALLIFQCDESGDPGSDTTGQSGTIFLLLRELRRLGKVKNAVVYTGYFREQVIRGCQSRFFREQDQENHMELYRTIDVLILSQYHAYWQSPGRRILSGREQILQCLELMP